LFLNFHKSAVFSVSLGADLTLPLSRLLTGMGSDGALGLKLLAASGWHTIAEHEESCVVYGMPRAAIEMGAAIEILPIEEVGGAIMQKLQVMTS